MASLKIPDKLKGLLQGSDLEGPIQTFGTTASKILASNQLEFFPYYTDHGIEHVARVLQSQVELIPNEVWEQSVAESSPRLLCDADAVVIIGATILHDFAMHLSAKGFLELVSDDTRFKPIAWFDKDHEGHRADRPWPELWQDYVREARRFSDRQLVNIVGPEAALTWKFEGLPEDSGNWTENHRLIIGEFIRRHHARLAHEIAVYGFPGIPPGDGNGEFPALGDTKSHPLHDFADLIGLVARSHGMSLRVCQAYLKNHSQYQAVRPRKVAVLYPMALLRVADYLQIDQSRAPAVLLQLRDPQSPISVQEWEKHGAILEIESSSDPRGKEVTVRNDIPLTLFLQLQDLLAGIQSEIDHSTAVLDEAYGRYTQESLDHLNLAIRRIHSNLHTPNFRNSLPYVPERTGFSSDPNLLSLLVEPLYGKEPSVGVRELIQNSVDAVRELDAWCESRGVEKNSIDLPDLEADVVVDFIRQEDGKWILRVQDRGIGMTADTIQNYFLRAGASFRNSPEWAKEFVDESGQMKISRIGRFGIGAFAIFLLGPSFTLKTRHVSNTTGQGFRCCVTAFDLDVEIEQTTDHKTGTTIEIPLSPDVAKILKLTPWSKSSGTMLALSTDWYCLQKPVVVRRVSLRGQFFVLDQELSIPSHDEETDPQWAQLVASDGTKILWTLRSGESTIINGIRLASVLGKTVTSYPERTNTWPKQSWSQKPILSIDDPHIVVPVTIQRGEYLTKVAPYSSEIELDVCANYIAWALVCGPVSLEETVYSQKKHPLERHFKSGSRIFESMPERRIVMLGNFEGFVSGFGGLSSLLNAKSYVMLGTVSPRNGHPKSSPGSSSAESVLSSLSAEVAITSQIENIIPAQLPSGGQTIHDVLNQVFLVLEGYLTTGVEYFGSVPATQFTVLESEWPGEPLSTLSRRVERAWAYKGQPQCVLGNRIYSVHEFFDGSGSELPLASLLRELHYQRCSGQIMFAGHFRIDRLGRADSSLEELWLGCLGHRPIPFDPKAREAMIEDACKLPQLRRHIEAWRELKRTGSKWANYQG